MLVSVILPVHNGMPYLPETMESILSQSGCDYECIAIDDGSTDGTTDYLQALSEPRVKYIRLEKVGLVAALNEGLRVAQSDLICRIDGDDVALPDRIRLQAAFLERHQRCVLVGCDFDEIDAHGNIIGTNEYNVASDSCLRLLMHFVTPFLHPGVMFRRSACAAVGGYRKTHDVAEDFDLWTRISTQGSVTNLPEKLMLKRIHPQAVSVVHRRRGLTQSRIIAADYARHNRTEVDPEVAGSLYWFHNTGEIDRHNGRELAHGLCCLVENYERENPKLQSCDEWKATVAYVRRNLGWKAFVHARTALGRPWTCKSWLSTANQFHPGRYTVASIAKRILSRRSSEARPLSLRVLQN